MKYVSKQSVILHIYELLSVWEKDQILIMAYWLVNGLFVILQQIHMFDKYTVY